MTHGTTGAHYPYSMYGAAGLRRYLDAVAALEAAHAEIKAEALAVYGGGGGVVWANMSKRDPERLHSAAGGRSRDGSGDVGGRHWSMLFFTRKGTSARSIGATDADAAAQASRFPRTLAALRRLPHLANCLPGSGAADEKEEAATAAHPAGAAGMPPHCAHLSAFLSLLPSGVDILPHCGPTNQRLRLHLPLILPLGKDAQGEQSDHSCCSLRVGGYGITPRGHGVGEAATHRTVGWEGGKVLAFDDAYEHEVVCDGACAAGEGRLVLVADILHPSIDVVAASPV